MTYQEAIDFLFSQLASYQNIGQKAFNKSLDKTIQFLQITENPHLKFKSIHVAGTNGKGSSCHMLSSVLQEAGYKVGLFTSPHLKSFTERIKINGTEVDELFVADFVERNNKVISEVKPSFFEMTTVMAFEYFAIQNVDIAIIETGLGGRFDSTNVITPEACLITSIGFDHQGILGDTIEEIAAEKAGIIKKNITAVIGIQDYNEANMLFMNLGDRHNNISFAEYGNQTFELELKGEYQKKNIPGILKLIEILNEKQFGITDDNIQKGLLNVSLNTDLKGRWQTLSLNPLIVCDTGHNVDGIKSNVQQLLSLEYNRLFMILGFVNDKDLGSILKLLPKKANYVFTSGSNARLMNGSDLNKMANEFELIGVAMENVNSAIKYCTEISTSKDIIFVGGSTFVVAEIENL